MGVSAAVCMAPWPAKTSPEAESCPPPSALPVAQEHAREKAHNAAAKPPPPNPLLLGLPPAGYVLRAVGSVRSAELEQALLLLPFTDALRLLGYLVTWLQKGSQVGGVAGQGHSRCTHGFESLCG